MLPTVCCEGWRLFWRPIKLISLYLLYCCFLVPFTELFRHTTYCMRISVSTRVQAHVWIWCGCKQLLSIRGNVLTLVWMKWEMYRKRKPVTLPVFEPSISRIHR
jgi:hypothetical protein